MQRELPWFLPADAGIVVSNSIDRAVEVVCRERNVNQRDHGRAPGQFQVRRANSRVPVLVICQCFASGEDPNPPEGPMSVRHTDDPETALQ
jgi:hypothetical protein